jgi:hypothetical protein
LHFCPDNRKKWEEQFKKDNFNGTSESDSTDIIEIAESEVGKADASSDRHSNRFVVVVVVVVASASVFIDVEKTEGIFSLSAGNKISLKSG